MEDLSSRVAEAIRKIRARVEWKPGKGDVHLEKRRTLGHLSTTATLAEYDALIQTVVGYPQARVFIYRVSESVYVAVRGIVSGRSWLIIFSLTGLMETAFPPDDIDAYVAQPGFTEIGTVEEFLA
jgi:hypothetical protein